MVGADCLGLAGPTRLRPISRSARDLIGSILEGCRNGALAVCASIRRNTNIPIRHSEEPPVGRYACDALRVHGQFDPPDHGRAIRRRSPRHFRHPSHVHGARHCGLAEGACPAAVTGCRSGRHLRPLIAAACGFIAHVRQAEPHASASANASAAVDGPVLRPAFRSRGHHGARRCGPNDRRNLVQSELRRLARRSS